jgi:hypothetical protein
MTMLKVESGKENGVETAALVIIYKISHLNQLIKAKN